jgi:flagellar basal body-associated protein FliL
MKKKKKMIIIIIIIIIIVIICSVSNFLVLSSVIFLNFMKSRKTG